MQGYEPSLSGPIKHVIVLMLENRSFDQMLGALQSVHLDLDGIDENAYRRTNTDAEGNEYEQLPNAARVIPNDPPHELDAVLYQIEADPAEPGNDPRGNKLLRLFKAYRDADKLGWLAKLWPKERRRLFRSGEYEGRFVETYAHRWPESMIEERHEVMNYFTLDSLPALHELARQFTVCDHWYSSVPGPTWANRFFFHSGTSLGTTRMPEAIHDIFGYDFFDQPTIYNRLSEVGRSWRIYFDDIPQSMALAKLLPQDCCQNFSQMDEFEADVQMPAAEFPDFVFIEPGYMGADANDDHPPHDTMLAQKLIARIYNGIRSNDELWKSSMFIVMYDEHGGFYDHVQPPTAVCPDEYQADYNFEQLGVRVPVVIVSPWVASGVCPEKLDHTSVGKYVCEKYGVEPLGKRMAQALSVGRAIEFLDEPREDTPSEIRVDVPMQLKAVKTISDDDNLNENQEALRRLSHYLEEMAERRDGAPLRREFRAVGADSSPEAVRQRTLLFLGR